MAYATVEDMIIRYGAAEITRLSTPDGVDATGPIPEPINVALVTASALIDTYLRKRYRVPLDVAPVEIQWACCTLARYDLSTGGERSPGEIARKDREDTIGWLGAIASGRVLLDLAEVAPGLESYATMQARRPMLGGAPGEDFGFGCNTFGFWEGGFS